MNMQLTVRLFALYRERAGRRSFLLELAEGATVEDLTDAARVRFPMLAPPGIKIVVAVNADYAEPELVLQPGDDVCLIPPVSGG
jgi:molybdopterin converting factor subunit 1